MSERSEKLPSFKNPPVVEVVLGTRFEPLGNMQAAHVGLFWSTIRKEFPQPQEHPPITSAVPPGVRVEVLTSLPLPRQFFISSTGSELIQLQQDRFYRNWRKHQQEDSSIEYPRYPAIKKPFLDSWSNFVGFTEKEKIGPITLIDCEMTYVNHIPKGELWEKAKDITQIVSILQSRIPKDNDFEMPSPNRVSWQQQFLTKDCDGNLYISLKHGTKPADNTEVYVLELTVRGKPKSSSLADIETWMDNAHAWIVKSFAAITSETAHKRWKREK